jgi:deoxyadenosine/deoxycytidine kinase
MVELKERLAREAITIGILGPTGVGKSTLSKVLGEGLDVFVVEEKFPKNPYLEPFYENPKKWSFKSQMWFFAEKLVQLRELDFKKSQIIDPAIEMDLIYAQTLHRINFMESREFGLYQTAFGEIYGNLQRDGRIRKPDIFLVLNAPFDVLERRIMDRGRPYELKMLKNYPSYLSNLSRNVEAFAGAPCIYVDAGDDGFISEVRMNNLIREINENI